MCVPWEMNPQPFVLLTQCSTKTHTIKQLITYKTTHVIYIILCSCPLLYVGKTKRALRTRIVEHMSAIRRQDHTPFFIILSLQTFLKSLTPRGLNEEMDLACFVKGNCCHDNYTSLIKISCQQFAIVSI